MPSKVHLETGVHGAESAAMRNNICIIVDVYRASSTIVAALAAGYEKIKILTTIENCNDEIIAGESNGIKLDKATFDNSPTAIINSVPKNKQLTLITTNGARCILAAAKAPHIIIGSLLNVSGVAQYTNYLSKKHSLDISIIQAGNNGMLTLDDELASKFIQQQIIQPQDKYTKNSCSSLNEALLRTAASKKLIATGRAQDVIFCNQIDRFPNVVPYVVTKTECPTDTGSSELFIKNLKLSVERRS